MSKLMKVMLCNIFVLMLVFIGILNAAPICKSVMINPEKKGNVIYVPYWDASGEVKTKLTIYNTSDDYFVVAKVVLRANVWSSELLDFFVYLSPRDVFRGVVEQKDGKIVFYSEDGSVLNNKLIPATPDDPFEQELKDIKNVGCGEDKRRGYIEIYEAYRVPKAQYVGKNTEDEHTKWLYAYYEQVQTINVDDISPILSASATLVLPNFDILNIPITAIEGLYPQYKILLGDETSLRDNFGPDYADYVDAVLSKTEIYFPNDLDSGPEAAIFVFPTKHAVPESSSTCLPMATVKTSSFYIENGLDVKYNIIPYDNKENTPKEPAPPVCITSPCEPKPVKPGLVMKNEVNFYVISISNSNDVLYTPYSSGLLITSFPENLKTNFVEYNGAPVIPLYLKVDKDEGAYLTTPTYSVDIIGCK